MASLQARSPLRSAHPLFVLNKVVSLSAFIILLAVGWVAVSYLKSSAFDRWRSRPSENLATSKRAAAPSNEVSSSLAKAITAPKRLVYSCAADKDYYHNSTHLPMRCERTAVSEDTALQRGLKRCGVCLPE